MEGWNKKKSNCTVPPQRDDRYRCKQEKRMDHTVVYPRTDTQGEKKENSLVLFADNKSDGGKRYPIQRRLGSINQLAITVSRDHQHPITAAKCETF